MVTENSILIKNWIARFNAAFHFLINPLSLSRSKDI